jgi:hypothetical protein
MTDASEDVSLVETIIGHRRDRMSLRQCGCWSYNKDDGDPEKPEVALPRPSWSERTSDVIMVDACIAETVKAIWDAGIITLSSCCGHGRSEPSLVIGQSSDGTPEIIEQMRNIIAEHDGRRWRLHQWQLVDV